MKRLIIAAGVLLFTAGTALAASDTGTIVSIDPAKDAITLKDGKSFIAAESVEVETFKVGQTVEVTYDSQNGKMVATKVVAK